VANCFNGLSFLFSAGPVRSGIKLTSRVSQARSCRCDLLIISASFERRSTWLHRSIAAGFWHQLGRRRHAAFEACGRGFGQKIQFVSAEATVLLQVSELQLAWRVVNGATP
jgi:hypothetical protein